MFPFLSHSAHVGRRFALANRVKSSNPNCYHGAFHRLKNILLYVYRHALIGGKRRLMVRSLPRPSWERAVLLIAGFAVMVLPRPALPFIFPGRILQHQSITRPCEMVGRVVVRRRNISSQAIKTGEWVLVKASGATAQVLSVNKGWLRVKEEGSDRIQSLRPTALHQLTQDAASVVDPNEDEQESYGMKSGPRSQHDNTPVLSQTAGAPLVVDAGITHPMHEETRDWLVFSDLHCSIQTLPVCLEVLERVHREARARGAGVIFLGDFFHIRGAIRVDLLNKIMAELGTWTQPVVLIPGNHDQVTLDGAVHALTPLGFAVGTSSEQGLRGHAGPLRGQALVVSQPTLFLNALWLPYARDSASTRAFLAAYRDPIEQEAGSSPPPVGAVFCHVDVRGAPTNDNTASRRGLNPGIFPSHIPTYSGHFHRPHRVPASSVTYVGSPYQVSLAEAGQRKRLLLLRRPLGPGDPWMEVSDIAIDVGRRYFRPRSLDAAQDLLSDHCLRKGDRVVLNLLPDAAETLASEVEGLRARLRASVQAELEVREGMIEADEAGFMAGLDGAMESAPGGVSLESGIMDYETLGTPAVWRAYMAEASFGDASSSSGGGKGQQKVIGEGLELIEAWESSTGQNAMSPTAHTAPATPTTVGGGSTGAVRLEFKKVKAVGYGPFLKAVEYPLESRGLVLLRGKNMDDPGAESNGAGKSKLAMAAQWALTGDGDEKPVMDAKVTDVAFDVSSRGKAAFAEVTLWGSVNDLPFQVTRKRGLKTNQLRFVLNGEDMTRQTARDTQRGIEEALGLDMDFLSLAIFCGQHQMNGLLEATDVKLKERLSKIVRLGVWEDIKEKAKAGAKRYQEEGLHAQTQVKVCELDLERQELEEVELMEALSPLSGIEAGNVSGVGADVQLLGGTVRTLDQVELELGFLSRQVEEAQTAWKECLQRRKEWAEGQAQAGQADGIRRERLRTLQKRIEEDERAIAGLQDRWDPPTYWAEMQRWGVVPADATMDPDSELAFAAHVPAQSWEEKLTAVESAQAKCLAEVGAATGDLRKVEGALESLSTGVKVSRPGMAGTDAKEEADGCPTCGRAWDEGDTDAKSKAIAHVQREISKHRATLQESEGRKTRLQKQKALLSRMVEAHVEYLRDVQAWQSACQRLRSRGQELTKVEEEIAKGTIPVWESSDKMQSTQPVDELEAREREFQELQTRFNKLQEERPLLIKQAAELQARERETAELRKRLERKRSELTKARERLEAARSLQVEQEEKARLYRELVDRFGMRGIQAFVLRGAVAQLERLANHFLTVLSEGGLRLGLSLEGERISKEVKVRGGDGVFHDRTLSHLSGGQWRRASLAALLAFRELSRLRSRVDCNLIVLDEVLNHLDGAGRARVGKLLRAMVQTEGDGQEHSTPARTQMGCLSARPGLQTAIVILQDSAAIELEDTFDSIDEVVKEGDVSRVVLDERLEQNTQGSESQFFVFEEDGRKDEVERTMTEDMDSRDAGHPFGDRDYYVVDLDQQSRDGCAFNSTNAPPAHDDEYSKTQTPVKNKKKQQQEQTTEIATRVVKGGWLDGMEEIAIK